MKKYIVSIAIPMTVLLLAFTFVVPTRTQAQAVNCPAGYTCTPVSPQPVGCPVGYTCTPVNTYSPSPTPIITPASCYKIPANLYLGSTGSNVVNLQSWLITNGYDIPAISSGITSKGFYGSQTVAALSRYQNSAKYRNCITTPTPINNNQSQASIYYVLTPGVATRNALFTTQPATIYGQGFVANSDVTVWIGDDAIPGHVNSDGSQVTFIAPNLTGSYGLYVATSMTGGFINSQTNKISVGIAGPLCSNGGSGCGSATSTQAYISYVQADGASQSNVIYPGKQATIFGQGFVANSTVTIWVGDDAISSQVNANGNQITFIAPSLPVGTYGLYVATSMTGGFINSQTNKINVTVPGSTVVACPAGYTCVPTPGTPAIGSCPANYTCTVTNSQVSVTVLYPNGGETLEAGKTYSLERRVTNFPSNGKLTVALENDATINTYLVAGDITNVNFPTIAIPSNIKPGKYKVRLFCGIQNTERYCSADGTLATNSSAQDYSDNYFTITAPVSNQQASITVTSPNGGETFVAGQPFIVTWVGSNFPSNGRVTVALQDSRTINTYLAEDLSNSGSATLTIPASIQPGAYTVRVFCGLQGSDAYCNSSPKSEDYSNASFNITSTQTSPSPTPVSGAPVITSIVGPSGFWANNSAGMWTIYVSDTNVGSITASVDWGDGSPITNGGNMGDGSVRFARQYTQAGTYTLTFTVRNQNGLTGQKTTTVQVW